MVPSFDGGDDFSGSLVQTDGFGFRLCPPGKAVYDRLEVALLIIQRFRILPRPGAVGPRSRALHRWFYCLVGCFRILARPASWHRPTPVPIDRPAQYPASRNPPRGTRFSEWRRASATQGILDHPPEEPAPSARHLSTRGAAYYGALF